MTCVAPWGSLGGSLEVPQKQDAAVTLSLGGPWGYLGVTGGPLGASGGPWRGPGQSLKVFAVMSIRKCFRITLMMLRQSFPGCSRRVPVGALGEPWGGLGGPWYGAGESLEVIDVTLLRTRFRNTLIDVTSIAPWGLRGPLRSSQEAMRAP